MFIVLLVSVIKQALWNDLRDRKPKQSWNF